MPFHLLIHLKGLLFVLSFIVLSNNRWQNKCFLKISFSLIPSSLSMLQFHLTRAAQVCLSSGAFGILVKNRRLITSWNNLTSALVWAPLSRTVEQAQPSAGRFISVSLDKPAGHHGIGTHILLLGLERKNPGPYEAVLSYLHGKKTGGLNEHELSLPLPFLALRGASV